MDREPDYTQLAATAARIELARLNCLISRLDPKRWAEEVGRTVGVNEFIQAHQAGGYQFELAAAILEATAGLASEARCGQYGQDFERGLQIGQSSFERGGGLDAI